MRQRRNPGRAVLKKQARPLRPRPASVEAAGIEPASGGFHRRCLPAYPVLSLASWSSYRQGPRPASPFGLRRPSGAPGRRTPTLSHPSQPRRRWVRSSGSPRRGTVPSRWLRRPAGEPRNCGWHLFFARVVHRVRAAPTGHRRSASPVEPISPPFAGLIISQTEDPRTALAFRFLGGVPTRKLDVTSKRLRHLKK